MPSLVVQVDLLTPSSAHSQAITTRQVLKHTATTRVLVTCMLVSPALMVVVLPTTVTTHLVRSLLRAVTTLPSSEEITVLTPVS